MSAAAFRVVWSAARDGKAHGRRAGAPRTACGLPAVDQRFAWPERSRCVACMERVDGWRSAEDHATSARQGGTAGRAPRPAADGRPKPEAPMHD